MTKKEEEKVEKKEDATDPSSSPDLTGEEESVTTEKTEEKEPKTAKGQVKPKGTNPLNAEPKEEKNPSEESETPESDAQYSPKEDDGGIKEEE